MVACYDDELLMECPLNSYVQVYDAFYGRLSLEDCAPDNEDEALGQYKSCPTSGSSKIISETRMHSSRMRTARSLTISRRILHTPPREKPCMPPRKNHAHPPGSNHTHPPRSNHACPPGATTHAPPPRSNHARSPLAATTHAENRQ